MIKDLKGLMDYAVSSKSVTISVAAADEKETLQAVIEAFKLGIARSYLTGNREWIEAMLEKLEAIGQHGIRKFVKTEKERWSCSAWSNCRRRKWRRF